MAQKFIGRHILSESKTNRPSTFSEEPAHTSQPTAPKETDLFDKTPTPRQEQLARRVEIKANTEKRDLENIKRYKDEYYFIEPAYDLIDAAREFQISTFSPVELQLTKEIQQMLLEDISKTIKDLQKKENTPTSTQKLSMLEEIQSRLSNLVIPESKGPLLRFEHARYKTNFKLNKMPGLRRNEKADNDSAARFGLKELTAHSKWINIQNGQAEELQKSLLTFAEQALTPATALLRIPGHAMLIAADPITSTYRFYDPTYGIFKFNSPFEFSEFVKSHTNKKYNNYAQEDVPSADLELAFPQITAGDDSVLGSGICRALSLHVGRWLIDHPGYEKKITTDDLGIGEWRPSLKKILELEKKVKAGSKPRAQTDKAPADNFQVEIMPLALK